MNEKIRSAISGMTPKARREYLVDHGLCPQCGQEAAPWYLCWHHRQLGSVRRLANTFAKRGLVTKSRDGHGNLYKAAPGMTENFEKYEWGKYLGDLKEDDKRLRPRLGRRPVDLDETLLQIFVDAGRPLSLDEVTLAWGKLRSRRKTGTLAGDMTKLIRAQRRRENRNAKRIEMTQEEARNEGE